MVGYDRSGAVRLVEESKFWAALLEGQVCGYLNLLAAPGPGCMLFIAPGTQIATLWAEIERELTTDLKLDCLKSVEAGEEVGHDRRPHDHRLALIALGPEARPLDQIREEAH